MIVGDSNMSETTTMLKVMSAHLVLRMIEEGVVLRDMTLSNPIRAIREISHDTTGTRTVKLANGRELSALQIQSEYFDKVADFVSRREINDSITRRTMDLWERTLKAVEAQSFGLIDKEIDWVIKWKIIERYMKKNNLDLSSPRIAQLDLAYHDINRRRGLFYLLERNNEIDSIVSEQDIDRAESVPPQTTRAKLRGISLSELRKESAITPWIGSI